MPRAYVQKNGYAAVLAVGFAPSTNHDILKARPRLKVEMRTPEFAFPNTDAALAWTLAAQARGVSTRWQNYPKYNDVKLHAWVLPPNRGPPKPEAEHYADILDEWVAKGTAEQTSGFRIMISCDKFYDGLYERNTFGLFDLVHETNKLGIKWPRGKGYLELGRRTRPLLYNVIDTFDENGPSGVTDLIKSIGFSSYSSQGHISIRSPENHFEYHHHPEG